MQIVADLYFLFVLMGGLIDVIEAFRLEHQMPNLPRGHRDQPAHQSGSNRIDKQQRIPDEKAGGADKMQTLVDAAVMVVAVIIPPLRSQCRQKALHHSPL